MEGDERGRTRSDSLDCFFEILSYVAKACDVFSFAKDAV